MNQFDIEFISRLIRKDTAAFGEFYEKTTDIFYRFVKGTYGLADDDISDILSDFYSKIWLNLSNIKIEYRFESYIWTVLRNTTKDFLSAKKLYNFTELSRSDSEGNVVGIEDALIGDEGDYLSLMQSDYEYEQIQSALAKIDIISQQVIFLKYIEGLSFEEISNQLSITNDNVRQKLSRGIKKIREFLESDK